MMSCASRRTSSDQGDSGARRRSGDSPSQPQNDLAASTNMTVPSYIARVNVNAGACQISRSNVITYRCPVGKPPD